MPSSSAILKYSSRAARPILIVSLVLSIALPEAVVSKNLYSQRYLVSEKEGLIKLSINRSEKSKLDNIESLTTIGNNLFDIISNLSPFLTSLFV